MYLIDIFVCFEPVSIRDKIYIRWKIKCQYGNKFYGFHYLVFFFWYSVSITVWHITSNSAFYSLHPNRPQHPLVSPDLRIYIYITLRAEAKKRTHKVVSETWPECLIVERKRKREKWWRRHPWTSQLKPMLAVLPAQYC